MRRNKRNYDTQWQSDISGEQSPYQMIKCAADRVATLGGLGDSKTESRACVDVGSSINQRWRLSCLGFVEAFLFTEVSKPA